jgi:hypothetical protein
MNIVFTTLKKILFWCYDRGTWQYDLLCVLILAFIFLVPNWIFNGTGRSSPDHAMATEQVINGATPPDASGNSSNDKEKSLPGGKKDRQGDTPQDR